MSGEGDGMETTAKHTPGPWTTYFPSEESREVRADGGVIVARIPAWGIGADSYNATQANAALIAAAPELLAVIERTAQWLEEVAVYGNDLELLKTSGMPNAAAILRAAIAKAKP
jgi:hypothetical protein